MKDKRFLVKRLDKDVVELQEFMNQYGIQDERINPDLVDDIKTVQFRMYKNTEIKFMNHWAELLTQTPF